MRDFTVSAYRSLLNALKSHSSAFRGFEDAVTGVQEAFIILRHDVDRRPGYALLLAHAEADSGIKASYHFRLPGSWHQENVIREIAGLGHEIAYHYEDLSALCRRRFNISHKVDEETARQAYDRFRENLFFLRKLAEVRVISMHGSPLSAVDNRLLWKYHDYHENGIVCEPYFDIDVSDVLYLTDTGRRWDGDRSNIRDRGYAHSGAPGTGEGAGWKTRPLSGSLMSMTPEGIAFRSRFRIQGTADLIRLAVNGMLPPKVIINTHPQRWTDKPLPWINELVNQSIKNQLKMLITLSKFLSKPGFRMHIL